MFPRRAIGRIPRILRTAFRTSVPVRITAIALVVLVLGSANAMAGSKRTYRLRRGVSLTTMSRRGPTKIRLLTITDPAKHAATVDVGTAGNDYPAVKRPSDIAHAYGAIAAVNGDFAHDGRPVHVSAEDGVLRTSGLSAGVSFALSADERRGFAKRPERRVKADTNNPQAGHFQIERWNAGGPGGGDIAAFTPVGGRVEKPEGDACSARLLPISGKAGKRRWGADGEVLRTYDVDKQEDPCPHAAPAVGSENGAVLVQGNRGTPRGETIRALQPGDRVTLAWTVGWSGVLDIMGGNPQLLADPDGNGRPTVKAPKNCGSYFCNRNPRTGVGVNHACIVGHDGCRVFIMEVDGRQPKWSNGWDLVRFAKEFARVGADYAINLDGGGGSVMWVANRGRYCQVRKPHGCLVSRPSDPSGERPAVTSLMVLAGSDRGGPLSAATRAAALPPTSAADLAAADAALTDPGSTGGMLDALFAGGLGAAPPRAPELRRDVQIYRSTRR
jgi:Phosphodiester glycosidase